MEGERPMANDITIPGYRDFADVTPGLLVSEEALGVVDLFVEVAAPNRKGPASEALPLVRR